ncbi:MAG: HAMP domain-containing sensor histidine kinase [Pseudomonadota bacterium]
MRSPIRNATFKSIQELRIRVLGRIAPLLLMFYAITYWCFHENNAARVCFFASLVSTLPIFVPFLRNSVLALTNFLLFVGNITVLMVGVYLGPYGIVLAPWCIMPYVIPLIIRDRNTKLFWWTLTSVTLIPVSIHFLSDYNPSHFNVSTFYKWALVSFFGLIILSITLIKLSMEIAGRFQKNLIESEHSTKILLSCLIHDMNNSLSMIQFSEEMITAHKNQLQSLPAMAVTSLSRGIEKAFTLVRQVSDMHRIRAGLTALNRENCCLKDIISETLEAMRLMIEAKNLQITFSAEERGEQVWTNPGILKINILENIISNAIKFSHSGGEIKIKLDRIANSYWITIRDYGVGMETGKPLKREAGGGVLSTPGTQGEMGAGLGMSIMKYFSDFIGVHIHMRSWVVEKAGERPGTEFKIEIPILEKEEEAENPQNRVSN